MKRLLLFMSLFGFVVSQNLSMITTSEIRVPINQETKEIDFSEYVDLIDGYYQLFIFYSESENFKISPDCLDAWYFNSIYGKAEVYETGTDDEDLILVHYGRQFLITAEEPIIEIIPNDNNDECVDFDIELFIRISGDFDYDEADW